MATIYQAEVEEIGVRRRNVELCARDEDRDEDDWGEPFYLNWGSGVPGSWYRYRNSGNFALSVGVLTGIAAYSWGFLPTWAGFAAGTLASVIASAVIQAINDARRGASRAGSSG
jgi:hypothetical protein